ncbi:MAG: alanine:cation symporter family protein [Coriobacteriales bacterium]|jgi:AGCS family alanine or glycine:cation symporter|nr:alanine:cation symporter family protein [Coriobacteriales bacterium]
MDIAGIVGTIDGWVWGPWLIVLLVGGHLVMTAVTRGVQFRMLPKAIKLSVTKDPNAEGDVSQFGALTTALSATIGTGNIVGVATAVLAGGPGAVFWMWIIGIFGIATKYSETFISVKYRVKDHAGKMLGGAMYAWERHFQKDGKTPWWAKLGAVLFALFAAIASFGIGSAVQSNAVASTIHSNFEFIPTWAVGLVIAILVALVLIGGIKAIARVCEVLVPFMAVFYVLGCLVIIGINHAYVLQAIAYIFSYAFSPEAAFGGAVGGGIAAALRFGAARGLFSNESGMGSAPLVAAAATTRNPVRQSLVSMTGTFWDTVIICMLTGIVLVSTMIGHPDIAAAITSGQISAGADLTTTAFNSIPVVGRWILVVGLSTFALSTILGWSYYGNRCVAYLFGKHGVLPYHILYIVVAFLGTTGVVMGWVWDISDIFNALMAVPNIICVLLLSGLIWRETKHYAYDGNLDEKDETPIPVVAAK